MHRMHACKPGAMSEAPRFGCLFSTPLVERVQRDEIGGSSATVLQPLPPLKVDQELDLLKACLDDAGRKVRFRAACATLDNFQRLLALGCRAVHFTGHGVVGKVGFELEKTTNRTYSTGEQYLVDVTQMRQLLAGSGGSGGAGSGGAHGTQLVFVSACHSASIAGVFVEAGVRHVVAVDTKHEVQDMAAVIFERTFYRQLLLGHTVRAAFDAAQATVATSPECPADEGSKFLLLPTVSDSTTDAHGRHDNRVFGDAKPGKWEDELPPLPPPVDTVAEFFVGRQRDVQQVLNFFVSKCARMVTVAGIHGVGKTQVALRFCEYARQRRLFNSLHFAALGTAAKRARRRSRAARRSAAGLRLFEGSPRAAMSGSVAATPEEEQPPTMAALVARAFGVSLAFDSVRISGHISGNHRIGRHSSRDTLDSSGSGRSDADADAEAEAEEGYVLERVREICAEKEREDGGGRRQLIVLDGCDDYLLAEATAPDSKDDSSGSGFCSFLTRLLAHVPSLSVLATSVKGVNECGKVENVAVRLVQISNFEPTSRESGMLFSVRCGRPLRKSEIAFGGTDMAHASSDPGHAATAAHFGHRAGATMVSVAAGYDNDYFLQLAHHPVVRELQGHPGALCDVAHQVSSEGLDLASTEHVQKLMTQVVPGIFDGYYGSSGTSMFRHSVHIHPSLTNFSPRNSLGGPYHPQLRHSISASIVQSTPRANSASPELRTSKSYQVGNPTCATVHDGSNPPSDVFGYAPLDSHAQAQSQAKRFEVARDALRNLVGGAGSDASEAFVRRGAQLWALAAVETGSPPAVATFAALQPSLGMFFNRGVAMYDGTATRRRLDEAGMRFLGSSTKIWEPVAPPLAPDGTQCNVVVVDAFARFFRWFDALVPVVRHTGLWDSVQPIKLHGFVNDAEAQRLLAGRAHGTFLLRFSESKPGALAVSHVHATGRFAKSLITVDVHGVPGSEYSMQCGNTTRSCGSLSGLLLAVCSVSGLLRLHPDHDPHDVFTPT